MPRNLSSNTRSRSPHESRTQSNASHRPRSRSPHRKHHHQRTKPSPPARVDPLPFDASLISRHDLPRLKPMFALYLDIQKNLIIDDLTEEEIKGRWKSFTGKWNRGELAEGWYDPETLAKARLSSNNYNSVPEESSRRIRSLPNISGYGINSDGDADDGDFGPALPDHELRPLAQRTSNSSKAPGPTIPLMQDVQVQREIAEEDASESRRQEIEDLRTQRQGDRRSQKERLDELVPRAEPGTRERQLEKKRELAASNRAFASSRDEPDVELREAEVMGEEDSLSDIKRMKKENERKKNEREIRREEVLRARKAEREQRMGVMKQKEDKTMNMLKEIAKARFGAHEGDG